MDVRRFPTEPWMASRKIASHDPNHRIDLSGKGLLFGYLLLAPSRESDPHAQRAEALLFAERTAERMPRSTGTQSHWIPAFAGMTAKKSNGSIKV